MPSTSRARSLSRVTPTSPTPEPNPTFHMSPEDFRTRGHELVDWIARYMENVADLPVASRSEPGDVRAALPASPPSRPESFDAVLADLDAIVVPGITHWQSPDFFAYFPANTSGPSILGELAAAGLGVQGMLWSTSPACTEVETLVLDWMVELLGLPARFLSTGVGGGVIEDSASSATLCAVLAARHRATTDGAAHADLVAYASVDAHSSVAKAIRVAGLAEDQLRLVDVDAARALDVEHLSQLVAGDVAAGKRPFLVCATVGTTSTMAIDPVAAVASIAAGAGAWVHVDAAMAGAAGVVPELRWIHDGVDLVDSWCMDPHKWLFTNFDCDVLYVADRAALTSALGIMPEYLRNAASESGDVIDYRDWQVPLGRRFRALKLWFVIRHYGAEGLAHHLRRHVELAEGFAARVEADDRFVLAAPPQLNLVCMRVASDDHITGDAETERVMEAINASGRALLSHTRVDGRFVIRVSIGQTHTEQAHVDALWDLLDAAASGRPILTR
jgi:aromatic-L-amino-acid/L-tryptophan decarboxylase